MTPDEFRILGHQLIEWVAAYRERLAGLPVMSPVGPGDVRRHFPASPPEHGVPLSEVLPLLDRAILPGITHWNHPRFFAYFPSNSSLPSVLADLVSAGLGAQGMSWQTSPAATELEEVTVDWLRQLVGLPETFAGVLQDTASTATLVALLSARERSTGLGQRQGGLQAAAEPLTVYASEMAHSSVEKAALLAGFGRENLRLLPTDEAHALVPDALAEALDADDRSGRRPCAVVATVGTHRDHRHRSGGPPRRARPRPPGLAPRGCGDGRDRDGLPGAALDVARRGGGRFGGVEPAQVAGDRLRLHRLPRAGSGLPRLGDVHRPELPPHCPGRRR